jgi:phosphatidylglycerophosphate synthase
MLVGIAATATISIAAYLRRGDDLSRIRGSLVLGPGIRGWYYDNLLPFEELCVRFGITPAALSYAQLGGSLLVALCYAGGWLLTAGWLLLFTGTLDIIDGRVARRLDGGSRRGAFLDSIIDRYADALGYLGLAVFYRQSWMLWVVLFGLIGGLNVSYTRARAEGLGATCHVGLLQRPERYVILGFGTIFGAIFGHLAGPAFGQAYPLVAFTVILLALLVNFTALQRVVHVWRALGDGDLG